MVSFPPVSPPRTYTPIRAACSAHLILLDFITRTILGEEYKSFSSSLCNLLYSPVTSSLLGPNILLNTIFSNTLSFLSSRSVNDQVSHPYKTTGKITVLYILILNLWIATIKKCQQLTLELSAINSRTVDHKDVIDNLSIKIRNCLQFPALCLHLSVVVWADHSLYRT